MVIDNLTGRPIEVDITETIEKNTWYSVGHRRSKSERS